MKRKTLISLLLATPFFSPQAQAADWQPSEPIVMQVGFAPGGSADTIGRLLAQTLEKQKGWKIVVENRPGGGGAVMAAGLLQRKADGLTIGLAVSSALASAVATRPDSPFKLDSFDYLGTVAVAPLALLAPAGASYSDLAGLVEYARKNGGATVGVPSKGEEMMVRAIAKKAQVDLRALPTKGGAEVMRQMIGGHTQAGFDGGRHVDFLKSGQLKMLASATDDRHSYAPSIKTLKEQGFLVSQSPFFVVMSPIGLPEEVHTALSKAVNAAVKSDAIRKIVDNTFGVDPVDLGVDGTRKLMANAMTDTTALMHDSQ